MKFQFTLPVSFQYWFQKPLVSFSLSLIFHLLILFLLCCRFTALFLHPPPPSFSQQETTAPPEVIFDLSPANAGKRTIVSTASETPLDKPPEQPLYESHENTAATTGLTTPEQTDILREQDHDAQKTTTADPKTTAESLTNTPATTTLPASTTIPPTSAKEHPVMGTLSTKAKDHSSNTSPMIYGTISNKGKSSVAAEATPIGRYRKILNDTIESHWRSLINEHIELLNIGTTILSFYVNSEGKVEELHVLSNTSNQLLAEDCLKTIREVPFPPIPPEMAKTLEDGRLGFQIKFTIYPDTLLD